MNKQPWALILGASSGFGAATALGVADADTSTRGVKLLASKRSILGFPLGDGQEAFPELESMPGRRGHPCRHADALGLRCGDDPGVDLGINSDGELRRRVTSWHEGSILP